MKFEKDIFISYAHIDDEALIVGESGWISEFHRSLDIRLAQLLGYRPKIWRDQRLDGNHVFSDEIYNQLKEIAILVSVNSPRYVKSDWCLREVNEFYKIAETNIGVTIGTKSRIFKVIKTPVDLALQPPFIQGLLGYEFYKIDPDTGKPREFSSLFGKEAQLAYWSKLDDLAHDLATLLTEIEKKQAAAQTNLNAVLNNGKAVGTTLINSANDTQLRTERPGRKIFLAETSHDCKANRDIIGRLLTDKGFAVLPDKNLSVIADDYRNELREILADCELSIHVLGANFGLIPEGTTKSKIQLQNEIAAEVSKQKKLQRLIWLPPELNPEDERQVNFIEELKRSEQLLCGADLIIAPLEDLKFSIEDKLNPRKKEINTPEENIDTDIIKNQVYLICDKDDIEVVAPLETYLFEKGFEVIIPAFEGDQTELRLDHQENLKTCNAVLIYYGAGSDLWLRSKMRDLLKISGYGRKAPLNHKVVCIAEPNSPLKERFKSHEVKVVKIESTILNVLDEFVNEIAR